MIAALGMYDMPELQAANDRFWALIRAELGYGPIRLARTDTPFDIWKSPDLVFAQTCGMPYRTVLHPKVLLVGTPDYGLPECPPGYYCSVLVTRTNAPETTEQEFRNGVFAYNEGLSQSGWAGPMTHLQRLGISFSALLQTGSHLASARAVADGKADLAGLDAITWELLRKHEPLAQSLKEVARTQPTPGLPFITSPAHDPKRIATAVDSAIAGLDATDRATLGIRGLIRIPKHDYLSVPTPPAP